MFDQGTMLYLRSVKTVFKFDVETVPCSDDVPGHREATLNVSRGSVVVPSCYLLSVVFIGVPVTYATLHLSPATFGQPPNRPENFFFGGEANRVSDLD
ncbi:hypothetical protein BDQ12DRAFT_724884 [Crucibulum laeve]|uniref:Uncharacterized protein n=1 Tax=Crucibulum laeve TaxID=68775 RepID=A0A5C3LU27_9AGAR|nr:hypothetical protein BDQ12DRAFT_724884 [Crucibulum laeve]